VRSAILLGLSLAAACDRFVPPPPTGPGTTAGPVTAVVIRPDSAQLIAEDSIQLTATPLDARGDTVASAIITWSVGDTDVAAALPSGLVVTFDSGRTVVRATAGGVSDSASIAVAPILYRSVAAGDLHTCAVGNNHRAYCWGADASGQLGVVPAVLERPTARNVAAGAVFASLAAASLHTCGLGTDSLIRCWGIDGMGQLGTGTASSTPALPGAVALALPYAQVAAGGGHTCGLTATGRAACWGRNADGELGTADSGWSARPTLVDLPAVVTQLAAGSAHTCGLTVTGNAVCWGSDSLGQLGDSLAGGRLPVTVAGGHEFTSLAAGGAHTCGLVAGAAWCWGANGRGESGTGLPDSVLGAPAPVTGGLSFAALSAGGDFTCGLTPDSLAYCWGANDRGQVGDGTQTDRAAPTAVSGGLRFVQLSAGAQHVCAVTAAGAVYCWGDGESGQLGLAVVPPLETAPTRIPFPP